MRNNLPVLLLTLFFGVPLYSQISTSIVTADSGQLQLKISNDSGKTITAYICSLQETVAPAGRTLPAGGERTMDSIASYGFKPVLPGESRIAATSPDAHAKFELLAAIFEDGTTFGNPEMTAKIISHRTHVLDALRAILPVLEKSKDQDFTTDAFQQQLSSARDEALQKVTDPTAAAVLKGEYAALFRGIKLEARRSTGLQEHLQYQQDVVKGMKEREQALARSKPSLTQASQ
jgi:hypothetical protein